MYSRSVSHLILLGLRVLGGDYEVVVPIYPFHRLIILLLWLKMLGCVFRTWTSIIFMGWFAGRNWKN